MQRGELGSDEIVIELIESRLPEAVAAGGAIFDGFPASFRAGRYHSLYAIRDALPAELHVTAESTDGIVMAIEHSSHPLAAVQFHPESILTLDGDIGLKLLRHVTAKLARSR